MTENDLKEELIANDDEYARLYQEHQECEERLDELHQMSLPSQEDEIEEKKIKLHKLALKDRMQAILREHRGEPVAV